MSMKRLNKEYCCSPSAKQYAHVLYELGISKEAVGETERLFEEVPVLEETFASPVVPMREKLSSIDKIFPEEIKYFISSGFLLTKKESMILNFIFIFSGIMFFM